MDSSSPVGLVVGTIAATPLQFSVAVGPEQYLQLDDVVVTSRELPGLKPIQVSGVVTNVEAVHEGARFASDVFLIEQGALPAEVAEIAQVSVTRVEPEVYVPPMPGAPVYRATGQQRDSALYFDEMGDQKVPVGFGRDGNPVYINFEFVDGTRGAHISISGVSGIATKTSFALFLLHSMLNSGVLKAEAHNTKMLVFSVKGEDLLFLDYANSRLAPEDRDKYSTLGLPAAPFQNVRVFAPPRPGDSVRNPGRSRPRQGRQPLLLDPRRVLHRRTAPLRLRRRRGRTRPVHDAHRPGRRPAQARRHPHRQRRRRQDRRRRPRQRQDHPDLRRPRRPHRGRAQRRPDPHHLGHRRAPSPAASTRCCAACARPSSRSTRSSAATSRTRASARSPPPAPR